MIARLDYRKFAKEPLKALLDVEAYLAQCGLDAKLLLARGADPHATTNDGKSALDLARDRNHPEVATLFQVRAAS